MVRQTPDEHLKALVGIPPDAHAVGTIDGPGIDTIGFDEALITVNVGVITATGTSDITVEESDVVGSGFTAITGAVFQQLTAANDETVYVGRVDVRAAKRFIRVVLVQATDAGDLGAVVHLSAAETVPVTQVNASEFSV